MFERVLVPLDGSGLAEAVFPYAEEVCNKFGSRLYLLRAVTPLSQMVLETSPGAVEASPAAGEVAMDVAQQRFDAEFRAAEAYLVEVRRRFETQGFSVETKAQEGMAAATILRYAREIDASLIAMSTHGRSGLGRLVFGSVADEVLRNSHLPVLIIRPEDG